MLKKFFGMIQNKMQDEEGQGLVEYKRQDEEGQGLVEYALILVLIAIVVIAVLTLLGTQVNCVFSIIASAL
jgi:pilus assembly protein Flp/PilA